MLDELRRRGWALGGEQSGHIIDLGFGPSGDGIASALLTLEALGGRRSGERGAGCASCPSAWSTPRRDRGALVAAIDDASVRDGDRARPTPSSRGRGRVLVRASGTEPLIRVMVEAPSESGDRHGLRGAGRDDRARARAADASPAAATNMTGSFAAARARTRVAVAARPLTASNIELDQELSAMCGIVGYVGSREARPLLLAGLRSSSTAGYDSAGISVLDGDRIDSVRAVGTSRALRAAIDARTRGGRRRRRRAQRGRARRAAAARRPGSATRAGRPTGASPRRTRTRTTTPTDRIHVVVNGIVENYIELTAAPACRRAPTSRRRPTPR